MNYTITKLKSSPIFIILCSLLLSCNSQATSNDKLAASPCIDGFWSYNCSEKCKCDLSEEGDFFSVYILEGLALSISISFLVVYFQKRKLSQRPNSFILMMAITNLFYSLTFLVQAVGLSSNKEINESCGFAATVFGMFSLLIELYVIMFFVYCLWSLRFTPEKKSSSTKPYHVIVWLLTFFIVVQVKVSKGFGKSVYGLCSFKSTLLYLVPLARYGIFTIITVVISYLIHKKAKSAHRISRDKKKLLSTFFPYAYYTIIVFAFEGINDMILVYSTNFYGDKESDSANLSRIRITSLTKNLSKSVIPLIFIIACWKGRHSSKKVAVENDVSYTESLLDQNYSMEDSYDVKVTSSGIRVRQSEKIVQTLYAFFAGFHLSTYYYYENVGSINMTDAEYKKVIVSDNSVKQRAPHLYEEVQKQDKEFPASEFQSYGSKIFDEITKDKEIKKELEESFDFVSNHSHILRYSYQENDNGEFFKTRDERFVLRIVTEKDRNAFMAALPQYFEHLNDLPDSLLIRVYGVFKLKIVGTNEVFNLILMKRICDESECILRHYELQGTNIQSFKKDYASQDFTDTPVENIKVEGILKDVQFYNTEKKLQVFALSAKRLLDTLSKDIRFLTAAKLGGYSVAVYVVDSTYRSRDLCLSIIQEATESNEHSQKSFFRKADMEMGSRNASGASSEQLIILKQQGYFRFDSTTDGIYYKIAIVDYFHADNNRSFLQAGKKGPMDKGPVGGMPIAQKEYGERLLKYFQIIVEGK